ncbi:hypothetical protein TNCV_467171 [Trichonephila clavipes]|nr:hypothetical protein TNCV_467171 [Trichonephila clavipes]
MARKLAEGKDRQQSLRMYHAVYNPVVLVANSCPWCHGYAIQRTVTSPAPGFWRDGVENKIERTRISGGALSQNCSKDVTSRRSWRSNRDCQAARGLLATDHVLLNHGQVTWTTPELAPPSPNYHTTPTGGHFSSRQIQRMETYSFLIPVFKKQELLSMDKTKCQESVLRPICTVESRKLHSHGLPGRLDSRPHPCKVSDAELTDAAASDEKMLRE